MFVWNRATRYLGWLKLGIGLFGWFLVESDWLFSSLIKYKNLLSKSLKSCLTLKNGLFNLTVLVLATLTLTRTVNQTVTAYHFCLSLHFQVSTDCVDCIVLDLGKWIRNFVGQIWALTANLFITGHYLIIVFTMHVSEYRTGKNWEDKKYLNLRLIKLNPLNEMERLVSNT